MTASLGKIPDESAWNLSQDAAMIYLCSNKAIDGVEFPGFPKSLEPRLDGPFVVADMSSIFFRERFQSRISQLSSLAPRRTSERLVLPWWLSTNASFRL
jgi:phosphoserine aminotransferase